MSSQASSAQTVQQNPDLVGRLMEVQGVRPVGLGGLPGRVLRAARPARTACLGAMTETGKTRAQQLLGDTAPDLVRLTDDVLFGEVWANPGLARIAGRLRATPAQVALAWLLAQQPWIAPIPGTRKLARLEENLAAAGLELTAADLDEIETASAAITVQGARYPEAMERLIDR
jgi:hypothetical protein